MFLTMHTAGDLGERGAMASMGHRAERWPPPGPPKKVAADGVGVFRVDAKSVSVATVSAAGVGVFRVDAKQVSVTTVSADGVGVHKTSAKQVDS